jgi:TolB protein
MKHWFSAPFRWLKAFFAWLSSQVRAGWHFLGRLGLACRNLLTWVTFPLVWPLRELTSQLLPPVWRYLGKLGTAARHIFSLILWPITWPLAFLFRFLQRGWQASQQYAYDRWLAGAPDRTHRKRRWRSWWLVQKSRWRTRLTWRRPPADVPLAPPLPPDPSVPPKTARPRLVFASVALTALLISGGFVIYQAFFAPPPLPAVASLPPTITPTPTITVTPFPTFTPTPAVVALTPWPTPDPLSSGGSVAFALRQNGHSDLHVLSVGQQAPVRITNSLGEDREPAWRPDGRQLAFSSNRDGNWDIYILDMPTGDVSRVTTHTGYDGRPSWSPDGQWLIYDSYRDNNLDVYIAKADGSEEPIRLTQHPAQDYAAVWGPDGRHIAFTSWRNNNKDVFLMSLDAVGDERVINLTNTPDKEEDASAFHPTGDYVAYQSLGDGLSLVYVQPLDIAADGELRPLGQPISLGQGRDPVWSPGGNSLAYVHEVEGQYYLLASSVEAWTAAPQTFATDKALQSPSWSAITLAQEPTGFLVEVGDFQDPPLFNETIRPTAVLTDTDNTAPFRLLELTNVDAPYPYLSDQVEQSFLALRLRVLEETGYDYLGNLSRLYEPLPARSGPGQSDRTWYKAGRAFDLDYEDVLAFEPRFEIVPEERGNDLYWRVYLLAENQDGSQGEPLTARPWDFRARYGNEPSYYNQGGKWKDDIPDGYYIDFTALASDYGWERVPALDNWRTYFPGIRFWQFEKRDNLTWEEAILEVHTAQEVVEALSGR